MGIRGDLEARYWAELGHEKPRAMVEHFFKCLLDPNAWLRMQRELDLSESQLSDYFACMDWLHRSFLTQPAQLYDNATASESNKVT